MLRMERTETIPLSIMQAAMRWDWVTFHEYLSSLERAGIGVNAASLVPTGSCPASSPACPWHWKTGHRPG